MRRAQELARPDGSNLAQLLEENIFTSQVMGEVCLFPKPQNKFQRMAVQNEMAAQRIREAGKSTMTTSHHQSVIGPTPDASMLDSSLAQAYPLGKSASQSVLHTSRVS